MGTGGTAPIAGSGGVAGTTAGGSAGAAGSGGTGTVTGEFWIAPDGDDFANGSEATPFRSLTKAALVAKPGNTIWVKPGTYPSAVTVAINTSGTEGNLIKVFAAPGARPVFERLFREHGLPARIRSDNGVPFATIALGRLSTLSVWWLRLGILPDLTEPASPQQNGRHERMHRTLKAEACRPPQGTLGAQQRRFDAFRREYNQERPHEA